MRIAKKFEKTFNRMVEKAQEMSVFSFLVRIEGITFEVCPVTNQVYKNGYLLLDNINIQTMVNFFFTQFKVAELREAKFTVE